jgi:transcription-repair coupling factor (superfamily II helicase)
VYFESEIFQQILRFIQTEVNHVRLKQVGKNFMLVLEQVSTMEDLEHLLGQMAAYAIPGFSMSPTLSGAL